MKFSKIFISAWVQLKKFIAMDDISILLTVASYPFDNTGIFHLLVRACLLYGKGHHEILLFCVEFVTNIICVFLIELHDLWVSSHEHLLDLAKAKKQRDGHD